MEKMELLTRIQDWHYSQLDHRLIKLPFMDGPIPTAVILFMYFSSVYFGPRLMKTRNPVHLNTFMHFYNLLQIILSASFILLAMTTERPLLCNMYKRSLSTTPDKVSLMMYYNYVSRLFEFTDTALLILRKKEGNLSFLHVYHHSANLLLAYLTCQYMPGGTSVAVVTINVMVHLIMYTYYFMSASQNVALQKFAQSFKKHLTQVQMIQFVYLCFLAVSVYAKEDCGGGFHIVQIVAATHFIVLLALFSNFYRLSYTIDVGKRK